MSPLYRPNQPKTDVYFVDDRSAPTVLTRRNAPAK
jgi:hypothetical protein